ncbi:tape measure protein [Streptococcus anginosus]|uniref:tape measure protein n=1 Tax=Streptococcus anginosus TaxID=1328 RepID=UPI0021F83E15|nr:tape measure protein [Streptococcus anginosus]MCW0972211.1 tape measure protein [Streptococcus anginosus]MCW1030649.1 tape measure protein [Streptococcus anginosus]MCW1038937.1 tape measure protein [Streptococcus anginosus]
MVKVQATMSTEIALDLVRASESVKSLTNVVSHATNAWKAQEAQLKAVGDYTQAAETKYKGLGEAIQAQQAKIDVLKQKQSELKGNTQQTAEQYLKYQQQIDQATTKLSSMQAQQDKAKHSMEYYSSGLAGLQTDYKKMNELSDGYVKRLEAEGKKRQAAQEKAKNLKEATENLSKQYKSQVDELEKIKNKAGATSEAYRKQKIRVNETATALAGSKTKMKAAREEMEKLNPTIWTRMRDSVKKFNNEAQKTSKIGSRVKDFVTGNLIANGISNITSKVISLAKEGYAAAEAASKTAERWQNLGFAENEIKRINSVVKDLKYNTNLSGGAAGELILKFHGITHNVDEAAELAKGVGSLSDQLKLSQERAEAFASGLGKIEASGTVTATSLNKLEKQAPGLVQALQKASGLSEQAFSDLLNSGKMTSKQFNDILKSAAKNYEENAEKYGNTAEGAKKRITLAWADTKKALMKPLVNVASTGFNQLANVLQNPAIQSGVTKIGEGIGKIAQYATNLLNYIAAHQKDVSAIVGNVVEITKLFALGVWDAAKNTVVGIANGFNKLTGNSVKSKDPIKIVASALNEVGKHKETIQTVGQIFFAYFLSTKIANGITGFVSGITGIVKGYKAWKTASEGATLAQKALNFAMASNPFGLAVVAITTLITSLVVLYQNNKKFRKFVDDIVKAAKDFFKGIGKWFGNAFKSIGGFFSNIGKGIKSFNTSLSNGVKKVGKFLGDAGKAVVNFGKTVGKVLIFANPFVLGFALMYKHSKPFRKFIKGIVKGAKDLYKNFKKFFGAAGKFVGNTFNGIKKGISKKYNQVAKSIGNTSKKIGRAWSKHWNGAKDFLSTAWDNMNKASEKKFGKDLKGTLFDNLANIGQKFQETWDGIKKGFDKLWQGMKDLARDGINHLIDIPNTGIDGINSLIHDFGGPKQTIGKIPHVKKFASGTGLFSNQRNPITQPTLALLNDGNDSPETGNKEMVLMPNGNHFIVPGKNTKMLLPAGAEVLNASETALLMAMQNQKAFAKGTGFWSNLWKGVTNFGGSVAKVAGNVWDGLKNGVEKFVKMLSFIGEAVLNPAKTLEKKFNPSSKGMVGMFDNFGSMLFKSAVNGAKTWWKELWSMAKSASNEGGVAMGAVGDDYRFKNRVADSGADPWGYFFKECVSFVASRLANLGVNPSLFSGLGNGNQWGAARVPHLSRPKPGSVGVYTGGPISSNHVDFITAVHGDTMDGEEYNWMGNHSYHQYRNRPISAASTFLDFGVKAGTSGDEKALKDKNSPLQMHIKKQTGGMFDWIKKWLAPLEEGTASDGGAQAGNPGGSGVERWRPFVERALEANGIAANSYRVSKILATIRRESNGDPTVQNNWDSNALAGHPSIGLMQTIQPTFDTYAFAGHRNIRNGYDNLLAAINYIKHRYGTSDAAFHRVASYGYANGGLVTKHGLYEVAEGNQPEYIIPMDAAKRGRAWRLLQRVVGQFVGESPTEQFDTHRNETTGLSELSNKLDQVIDLLSKLLLGQGQPVVAQAMVDGNSFAREFMPYLENAQTIYNRRQETLGRKRGNRI